MGESERWEVGKVCNASRLRVTHVMPGYGKRKRELKSGGGIGLIIAGALLYNKREYKKRNKGGTYDETSRES